MIPENMQSEYATLVENIHWPVFAEKLASDYGVVARTEEDKLALLELAGVIQVAKAEEQVKQASAGSPYAAVVDELKTAMNHNGSAANYDTTLDRLVKQAAVQLSENPEIADAAAKWASFLVNQ